MSEVSNFLPVADQLSLVLHTAVDFSHNAGIGIGIIQSAATGTTQASTLPTQEQEHSIERGQATAKNLKTRERAHMFALILAMGLARSTLKRQYTTTRFKVQRITVLCSLPAVVGMIKYHRAHGPKSLESVVSKEDYSMTKRVMESIKRLSRYNVQVSIAEDGADGNAVEVARVKMMARHAKKKPCRRRRHARRTMSANAGTAGDEEEEDGGSDAEGNGTDDGEEGRNDSSH
jgi:hypothetical protein